MNKAVYLLAGAGSRLWPITDSTPKALLEINGTPLLARSVDSMIACGVSEFVVVTGFCHDSIRKFFRDAYPGLSVEFIHNGRYQTTNNACSLLLTRQCFDRDDGMILLDGDILYEHSIAESMLTTAPMGSYLAVRPSRELGEEEIKVALDDRGNVRRIGKTLSPEASYGESIGIAKFSPGSTARLFETLDYRINALGLLNEFYEASFQQIIDQGELIGIVDTGKRYCIEIDTLEDLERAIGIVAPYIVRKEGAFNSPSRRPATARGRAATDRSSRSCA